MKFNERIKLLRHSLKSKKNQNTQLTLREMSENIGIPLSSISKYEQGIIKPGVDILSKYCKVYGVNLNWLVAEEGEMFASSDENINLFREKMEQAFSMTKSAVDCINTCLV